MSKVRLILYAVLAVIIFAAPFAQPAAADNDPEYDARLRGSNEIPARETNAKGKFESELSSDGMRLRYVLQIEKISNVVAAHIHLGSPTENGPVVAFLYGPMAPGGGFIKNAKVRGVITEASLVGPLAGQPLSVLIEAMEAGNTYVNVHTNDGIDPTNTGPGDFPGGEIRGQIWPDN